MGADLSHMQGKGRLGGAEWSDRVPLLFSRKNQMLLTSHCGFPPNNARLGPLWVRPMCHFLALPSSNGSQQSCPPPQHPHSHDRTEELSLHTHSPIEPHLVSELLSSPLHKWGAMWLGSGEG